MDRIILHHHLCRRPVADPGGAGVGHGPPPPHVTHTVVIREIMHGKYHGKKQFVNRFV